MTPPRRLVLTFDNLGEAAFLEDGTWPEGRPTGSHPSVDVVLPWLLARLDELELRATFFVEAWNTVAYPEAVRSIADRGHEVGLHGWRHERWSDLGPAREREILERSKGAFSALGIDVEGFRPPGGLLAEGSLERLVEAGLTWCSPEGEGVRYDPTGILLAPFRWSLVDVTYSYGKFADLRRSLGIGEPLDPGEAHRRLREELDVDADPVAATLILHPFMAIDPVAREEVGRLLAGLAEQVASGTLSVSGGAALRRDVVARGR